MLVRQGIQPLCQSIYVQDIHIGQCCPVGTRDIELQPVSPGRIQRRVGMNSGVPGPRQKKRARARLIVSDVETLTLPAQRQHLQPAVIKLMLPLLPQGQKFRFDILDILPLIASGESDQIGHRRIQRQFIPGAQVLSRYGKLGLGTALVAHGIDPVFPPGAPETGAHIGRKTDTRRHRASLPPGERNTHWNGTVFGTGRRGVNIHTTEVAAVLQVAVESGNFVGMVGGTRLEGDEPPQKTGFKPVVFLKRNLAETVPLAAVINQGNRGAPGCRVHFQGAGDKPAIKIPPAAGPCLEGIPEGCVLAVIENIAFRGVNREIGTKPLIRRRRAPDFNRPGGHPNGLSGTNGQYKLCGCVCVTFLILPVNRRAVIAQGPQRLPRLTDRRGSIPAKVFGTAAFHVTDKSLCIFPEVRVISFHPHVHLLPGRPRRYAKKQSHEKPDPARIHSLVD